MSNLEKSEAFWQDVVAWGVLAFVVVVVVAGALSFAHWAYTGFR